MEIATTRVDGLLVLAPEGKLDMAGAADLQLCTMKMVDSGDRCILVDLAGTSEVSGAAFRVLLTLGKRLAGLGGALTVCGLTPEAFRTLEVAGLGGIIEVVPTRAEALARVKSVDSEKRRVEQVTELAARLLGATPTRDKKKTTKGKD